MHSILLNSLAVVAFSSFVIPNVLVADDDFREIDSFSELAARHTSGTVYFLDLDNTTLRPDGFFGSDPWFKELVKRVIEQGVEYQQWRRVLNTVVAAISNDTPFRLVDPAFRQFYELVGPQGFIGLTARSKDFQREVTKKHLDDLNLHFRASTFFPRYAEIENLPGTLFAHESGVIIIGRLDKGTVLRDFSKLHGKDIKRIVFVDDLTEHAKSVGVATKGLDIPVESYRLRAVDQYLQDYDSRYRGRWSLEEFLKNFVFGKYHHLVTQYPEELALLRKIKDPAIFDTSLRFTEFKRGWEYKYTPTRLETVHKPILGKKMLEGTRSDSPMLLFTSGSMGVGKGFSVKSLMNSGIIDPNKYLIIDPDEIKAMIPEYADFLAADPLRAARFVHVESGHIQERLTELALRAGKNIIIDGSLGAYDWWKTEIPRIQKAFPHYTTAIITVSTDEKTQQGRIAERALDPNDGRDIEEEIWRENRRQVEASVSKLREIVDFQIQIDNGARPKVTEAFIRGETHRLSYRPNVRSGDLFASNALFTSSASKVSLRSTESILTAKHPLFVSQLPPSGAFETFLSKLHRDRDQLVVGGGGPGLDTFVKAAKVRGIDVLYIGDPSNDESADYHFVIDGNFSDRASEGAGDKPGVIFRNDDLGRFFEDRARQFPGCGGRPECLEDIKGIPNDRPILSLSFGDIPPARLAELKSELTTLLGELDSTKVRLILDVSHPETESVLRSCLAGTRFETIAVSFGPFVGSGYTQFHDAGPLRISRKGFYDRLQDRFQKENGGDFTHLRVSAEEVRDLASNLVGQIYRTSPDSPLRQNAAKVKEIESGFLKGISATTLPPERAAAEKVVVLDGLRSQNYPDRASFRAHLVQTLHNLPDGTRILVQTSHRGFGNELDLLHSLVSDRFAAKKLKVGYFLSPGNPLPDRKDFDFVIASNQAGQQDVLQFSAQVGLSTVVFGLEPDGDNLRALLNSLVPLEIIDDPSLQGGDKGLLVSLFDRSRPIARAEIQAGKHPGRSLVVRSTVPKEFLSESASAAAASEISRTIDSMSDSAFVRSLLLAYRELILLVEPTKEPESGATGGDRIHLGPLHLVNGHQTLRLPDIQEGPLGTKISSAIFGKEFPEFDRSVEMSLLIKLILEGRYEDFTRPQKPEPGDSVLSKDSFKKFKTMVETVAASADDLNTMLTYLNMMRIGKSDALMVFLQREAGIVGFNHNQVLPIALKRFPDLFPSYARLPSEKQAMIRKVILSDFNMGQLIQGENTVVSLEPLRGLNTEESNLLLVTNIIKVAGARGHDNIVGSSVITENVFGAFNDSFVELSKLSSGAEPRKVYEKILKRRGTLLDIAGNDTAELAAIKLSMMFRVYSEVQGTQILKTIRELPEDLAAALCSNILNEGYENMFALPYYGPKLMEKSRLHYSSKGMSYDEAQENGIRHGLPLIAKLFESVRVVRGSGIHKVHADTLIGELPNLLGRDLRSWHVAFDKDPVSGELLSRAVYAPTPASDGVTTHSAPCPGEIKKAAAETAPTPEKP